MSIAEKFETIADEVYEKGISDGYQQGFEEGASSDYNAGVQAEYDRFWDIFQQNGNRTKYNNAFGGSQWTPEIFKPKYPIRPTNAYMMFFDNTSERLLKIPDFVEFCKENNIVLDFSNVSGPQNYTLAGLHTTHHGVLDFSCKDTSKTITMGDLFYSHGADYGIKIIDEFICSERTIFADSTFKGATYLEQINFSGTIASNNLNLSYCPKLTHDSLMSIINTLKDYSGTTTTRTVTLGSTNLAKLTDAEKAIATQKGWTLA